MNNSILKQRLPAKSDTSSKYNASGGKKNNGVLQKFGNKNMHGNDDSFLLTQFLSIRYSNRFCEIVGFVIFLKIDILYELKFPT